MLAGDPAVKGAARGVRAQALDAGGLPTSGRVVPALTHAAA